MYMEFLMEILYLKETCNIITKLFTDENIHMHIINSTEMDTTTSSNTQELHNSTITPDVLQIYTATSQLIITSENVGPWDQMSNHIHCR